LAATTVSTGRLVSTLSNRAAPLTGVIAMPRKGAPAPTDADDRFDDSRHPRRTLPSNGKQASAIWAGVRGNRRASRTCAFCECARQHVGAGWTLAALAFAQIQACVARLSTTAFCTPAGARRAFAMATEHRSAGACAGHSFATRLLRKPFKYSLA